jgi:putative intracellular protease/amidase
MKQARKLLVVVTSHGNIDGKPTTGIWFSEFAEPYDVFVEAGIDVTVASPRGGAAPIDPRGYPTIDAIAAAQPAMQRLNATLPLDGLTHEGFDALFFPGGHGPMFDLAGDARVKRLIGDFWQADKPVGAVCHGPAALLDVVLPGGMTLLHGRRVTGFSAAEDAQDALFAHMPFSLEARLRDEAADFSAGPAREPHVEIDGRLVTGQNPASATAVARAFVGVMEEH